jgi:hypothetical protein
LSYHEDDPVFYPGHLDLSVVLPEDRRRSDLGNVDRAAPVAFHHVAQEKGPG